jgi:rod shape-determining protein MreC
VLGISIILSIAILTISFRESNQGIIHRLQRASLNLIAPIQAGVTKIVNPVYQGSRAVGELFYFRRENKRLRREVASLRGQTVELQELRKENSRLRRLAGFARRTPYRTISAHVIGKSTSDWQASVILDKGSADGIRENMPVVVAEGLVGQVVEVASHASQVQLLTDQKSGVGAEIQETGETGVAQGQLGGDLRLLYVDKNSEVKKGDRVVTSGLGGVFPKGIFVGTVVKVKEKAYVLHKEIKILPAVDFSRLAEVLIITNPPPRPPFGMEEE